MQTPAIELRGATRRFADGAGVGPVDLAVAPGETVALIGESGSGKSTLLRLVLGLDRPDAGEVRFAGAPVRPEDDAVRRRIGYVIQGGALFPHLTAAGNATLVARHLRWDPTRVERRLRELEWLVRLPPGALRSRLVDPLTKPRQRIRRPALAHSNVQPSDTRADHHGAKARRTIVSPP